MRKLLFAIFILFTSCVAKDSPFSPSLAKVLDGIIGKTHNFDVIQVIASKLEEHDLLIITCVPGYNPKVMDGYYIYKDKLITYYQTDSTDRSDIIDTKYLYKYEGNIPNYIDVYEKLIFCEPKQYLYEIIDGRKLTVVNNQKSLGFRKNEIKGDNVIKNKQLNKILNDFIYSNVEVLYELRFKTINKKHYAIIRSGIYYGKDKYKGYFYRDGNLIVLYGDSPSEDILDKTQILTNKQGIPNYKYGTIDEWNYPYPLKFEILPNGNLRKLSFSEGFAI